MTMSPMWTPMRNSMRVPWDTSALRSVIPALNGDRTAHGIDSTGKLDQYSIARRLYDAAGMLGNLGVEEFTAMQT